MSEREDPARGVPPAHSPGPDGATARPASTGPAFPDPDRTTPDYSTRPVAFRRPDKAAALLLLLSGVAAALSLLLRWLRGNEVTGLDLVRRGFDAFGQSVGEVIDSGFWQPLVIVLGGAALFVLGLLMLLPARTHRFLGLVALLVSLLVTAAVLVPLGRAGWSLAEFAVGFWCAIAVAALGLLGALKALLTAPKLRGSSKT